GARHQHHHPHATAHGRQKRLAHLLVEHEVRVRDVHRLAGRRHGQQQRGVHRGGGAAGGAAHDLHVDVAATWDRPREVRVAAEHHAGGLEPVLGEGRLEVFHHRTLHAHVGVAPVLGGTTVAHPLAAHAGAPGEAEAPVDDDDTAMVAIVV